VTENMGCMAELTAVAFLVVPAFEDHVARWCQGIFATANTQNLLLLVHSAPCLIVRIILCVLANESL
jgi:hypothetical protein